MTPKQKAQELVFKMFAEWMQIPYEAVSYHLRIPAYTLGLEWNMTKHCALIAVDELICEVYNISHQYTAIYDITTSSYLYTDCKELTYWNNVKQEIEAL